MKKAFDDELKGRTVEQLVAEFRDAGVEQSHAELYGKISKYNRLIKRMLAIQTELKNRPGDARGTLWALERGTRKPE